MRFVLLHHTGWRGRADHYDLMLQTEEGGGDEEEVLKTFATLSGEFPDGRSHSDLYAHRDDAGDPAAQRNLFRLLTDHRRAYLTFEGPLSGDRGSVLRVDEGALEWLKPPGASAQELRFRLAGAKLKGEHRLRHLGGGIYAFERMKRT